MSAAQRLGAGGRHHAVDLRVVDSLTMESALPGRIEQPAAEIGFWSSLVDVLARFARGTTLSDSERHRLHLIGFAASRFGAPLLSAGSLDELDDRVDTLISDPEILQLGDFGIRSMPETDLHRLAAEAAPPPPLVELLGRGTLPHLEEGFRLMAAAAEALASLLPDLRAVPPRPADPGEPTDPLAFLSDPAIPAEVGACLLGAFRAVVCLLAIAQVVITRQRPEPWLARAIVERWTGGMRAQLRLLASLPGLSIPESFIPAEERLDIAKLSRQAQEADRRMREMMEAAKASGENIYREAG